ncbi:MAG: hypothetical protein ACKVS9_12605 [Phycisphaerae bacterium]
MLIPGMIATRSLLAATDSTALLVLLAIITLGGLIVALRSVGSRRSQQRPDATAPHRGRADGGSDSSAGSWLHTSGSSSAKSPGSQPTPVAHQAVAAVTAHQAFASSQPASDEAIDESHDAFDCGSDGADSGGSGSDSGGCDGGGDGGGGD